MQPLVWKNENTDDDGGCDDAIAIASSVTTATAFVEYPSTKK